MMSLGLSPAAKSMLSFTKVLGCCVRSFQTDPLKEKLAELIPEKQEEIREFRKNCGSQVIDKITVNMLYTGMRDAKVLVTETSNLDASEGIRYRGYPLTEAQSLLMKNNDGELTLLPEGTFWLLLTGEIPTMSQMEWLSSELYRRSEIPDYVVRLVDTFPKDLHPMAQLSAAITTMHKDSQFAAAYNKGIRRSEYWQYVYEDALNLVAKINSIAALIYCRVSEMPVKWQDVSGDWSLRFAEKILEKNNDFVDYLRVYFFAHADHEGGNVSAHTCHLVGSALSDPFLAYGAALNGLAGPLHGRANQESVNFVNKLLLKHRRPTDQDIDAYLRQVLKDGYVIPGCGHAVLRVTDPRFTLLRNFGENYIGHDKRFQVSCKVMDIASRILTEAGKTKNPWPNVDAISGSVLWHYGFTNTDFYTVLFGLSRCMGTMASLIWDRALQLSIERPKSYTTPILKSITGCK